MQLGDFTLSGEGTLGFLTKIGVLLFLSIYLVFAATIVKQVRIMVETLSTGFETQIRLLVFLHFALSLLVLIVAIVIL